jgi:hypothetical protein
MILAGSVESGHNSVGSGRFLSLCANPQPFPFRPTQVEQAGPCTGCRTSAPLPASRAAQGPDGVIPFVPTATSPLTAEAAAASCKAPNTAVYPQPHMLSTHSPHRVSVCSEIAVPTPVLMGITPHRRGIRMPARHGRHVKSLIDLTVSTRDATDTRLCSW